MSRPTAPVDPSPNPLGPIKRARPKWMIPAAVAVVAIVVVGGIGLLGYLANRPSATASRSGSPSSAVTGTLLYQPDGANYTHPQPSHTGIIVAMNGTSYKVDLGSLFAGGSPISLAAKFALTPASGSPGYFNITSYTPLTPSASATPGSEVNVSFTSVGIAGANLTLGFSVTPGEPVVYLAFGTYPTFFSNVTVEGVDLNVSTLLSAFNINLGWLKGILAGVDALAPAAPTSILVVNQTLWLPQAHMVEGQAQLIVTPNNVSQFLGSIAGGGSVSMLKTALSCLNEELVVVATATPGSLTYWFLLAPDELTRANLDGIVTLGAEESFLSVFATSGTNPLLNLSGGLVSVHLGVTWDHVPVSSSGYTDSTVRDLWLVPTLSAVRVSAPAIGVSLTQLGAALNDMGYNITEFTTAIASVANPAVFIITDSSTIGNLNETLSYRSYALAIVPSDILDAGQHSLSLYLQFEGVVYNTSYFLGGCGITGLPGCPILVVDTLSFIQAAHYLPTQLGNLTVPTFINTTGFLTGTTVKTVAQYAGVGALDYLVSLSPIDVGFYDMGYSNGWAGFNLPTLSLTWGQGPTLLMTNYNSTGLYIPVSSIESELDFTSFEGEVNRTPWNSSGLSLLESGINTAIDDLLGTGAFNGSVVVPGVYLMMESWQNTSPGDVVVGVADGGISPCPFSLNHDCIVSNISLSANSGSYLFPPNIIGIGTNLSSSNATYSDIYTASYGWIGPIPVNFASGAIACGPFGLCGLDPYHVTRAEVTTCFSTSVLDPCLLGVLLAPGTYTVAYPITWDSADWFTLGSFQVTIT